MIYSICDLCNRMADRENGKTFVCDKHDMAITCQFCLDHHLKILLILSITKISVKTKVKFDGKFFQHNFYWHACHTKFVLLFPPPLLSFCDNYCCQKGVSKICHNGNTIQWSYIKQKIPGLQVLPLRIC